VFVLVKDIGIVLVCTSNLEVLLILCIR
jgi:hypothetical protein